MTTLNITGKPPDPMGSQTSLRSVGSVKVSKCALLNKPVWCKIPSLPHANSPYNGFQIINNKDTLKVVEM